MVNWTEIGIAENITHSVALYKDESGAKISLPLPKMKKVKQLSKD